jgi:hypothetical protein
MTPPLFPTFPGRTGVIPGIAWYGLAGLGEPPAAYLPKLRPAGFALVESALFRDAEHRAALRGEGLLLGAAVTGLAHRDEVLPAVAAAAQAGAAYVRMKILTAWHTPGEVAAVLDEIARATETIGIPVHIETHRETASQDLHRWAALVAPRPWLRLTLDVSHYRITGDWPREASHPAQAAAHDLVLARTSGLHLRICDGEHIQVAPRRAGPWLAWHRALWLDAIARWRAQAPAAAGFPAIVELLAPPFAPTAPDGRELGDRWSEAQELLTAVFSADDPARPTGSPA